MFRKISKTTREYNYQFNLGRAKSVCMHRVDLQILIKEKLKGGVGLIDFKN